MKMARKRDGFTLVELLVVIGIIAVLVGILLPALNKARSSAQKIKCAAQLRNLGQAFVLYANANKGRLPQHSQGGMAWLWDIPTATRDALVKCGASRTTLYCPEFSAQDSAQMWDYNGFTVVGYYILTTRINTANNPIVYGPAPPAAPPAPTATRPMPQWLNLDTTGKRQFIDRIRPSIQVIGAPNKPSDIELATDAIIRSGTLWAATGGWTESPHVTGHIYRGVPTGGNILYLDSHVDFRQFKQKSAVDAGDVKLRAITGTVQFWF